MVVILLLRHNPLLIAFCVFIATFHAQAITSTETLPQGVRAGAFIYGVADGLNSTFNSDGRVESLTNPLNRTVTIAEMAEFEPDLKKLQVALNSLSPEPLGDKLLKVDLFSNANVREERYHAALLWGLSDRLSVGVIVPAIRRVVEARFEVKVDRKNLARIKELLGNSPQLQKGISQLESTQIGSKTFEDAIFKSRGFEVPSEARASGLGDIELEARYSYYRDALWGLGLRGRVRMPTATHEPELNNLLDRPLGEGNWSARVGSLHDLNLVPGLFSLRSALFVTWNLPSDKIRAIPLSASDPLPDLNDPNQIERIRMQRGARLDTDFGAVVDLFRGLVSLSASYLYTVQGQDSVQGQRNLAYSELVRNSAWEQHAIELGVELSSVSLFQSELFPLPGKIGLSVFQPVAGVNTIVSPYGRFDVILFF